MAISMDLRVLARKLEKNSDDLLVKASHKAPEVFEKVATAIAAASTLLEGVADDMDKNAEFHITPQQLDEIAALATAFSESGDPLLNKQASVLDEILLSVAAPKNAAQQIRKIHDDEITRLRDEYRKSRGEEAYVKPREAYHEMWNSQAQAKAVEDQVKRYVPLEAPLQTRYPPDRPGGQMTRITDHVYQDITTGIIYDFKKGYKTQKGNEVPGGSVENQTRQLGDYRNQGTSLFETRDSLMGRYAEEKRDLTKYSAALRAVRDQAPDKLNSAIDAAWKAGLSTTEVANCLSDTKKAEGEYEDLIKMAGWGDFFFKALSTQGTENIKLALNTIQEFAPHLLKAAVQKARKELSEQQVVDILSTNNYSNFGTLSKTEEQQVLQNRIKNAGWQDLLKRTSSGKDNYSELKRILKTALPAENLFGNTPPSSEFMMGKEEEEEPTTIRQIPEFGEEAPPPSLFSQMFGEPEKPALITPNDDLQKWLAEFESVKSNIAQDAGVKNKVLEFRQAGKKAESNEYLKGLINDAMHNDGFVGAFEADPSGKLYIDIASGTRKTVPEEAVQVPEERATNEGKELPWEQYQIKNNIAISDEKAKQLEKEMFDIYQEIRNGFERIYSKFSFPGSDVPHSINRLPKEVKEKLIPMYIRGENTEAMYNALKDWIPEWIFSDTSLVDELTKENVDKIRKSIETLMREAEVLESDGKAEEANKRIEQAEKKERYLNENLSKIQRAIVDQYAEKMMPTPTDLKKARASLRGFENKKMAEDLKKEALTNARRGSINLILEHNNLPPMYKEVKILSDVDFTRQLEQLGETEASIQEQKQIQKYRSKERGQLIHSIPEDATGTPLTTVWDNPSAYMAALATAKEMYPMPRFAYMHPERQAEIKEKWDEYMKNEGFVPPSYKLFGAKGSTLAMLRGVNLDEGEDPIPDFKGLKNLFDNPREYAENFIEGYQKFNKQFKRTNTTQEFEQIRGHTPAVSGVPFELVKKVRNMMNARASLQDAIMEFQKDDIPPSTIEKVWKALSNSGKQVKGYIKALIRKGVDLDKIEGIVKRKYSEAYIPEGAVQGIYNLMMRNAIHNKKVREEWDLWSMKQGFYPPNRPTIGIATGSELLNPRSSYMAKDPDIFGATPMAELGL